MDQSSNYITVEMNFRFQMKDYRLLLGVKRTWIIASIVGLIQIFSWIIKKHN